MDDCITAMRRTCSFSFFFSSKSCRVPDGVPVLGDVIFDVSALAGVRWPHLMASRLGNYHFTVK